MFLKNPMDDILHYCLTTPRDNRDKAINEALCHFFQSFPYFRSLLSLHTNYGHIMYTSLIKALVFKSYKKGEIIVKENDTVNAMLILVSGTAVTYKQQSKTLRRCSNVNDSGIRVDAQLNNIEKLNTQGCVLSPGEITKVKKHPHCIQAKTPCIIGELPLMEYTLIFEKTQLLEKASLSTFVDKLKIFNDLAKSKGYINKFLDVVVKRRYDKNNIVVHKGEAIKSFFIIRQGVFQVILPASKTYLNTIDLNCFRSEEEEKNERFTSERVHEFKDSYRENVKYKLLNLTEGEMFGVIEMHLGRRNYMFDLVCKEDESEILEVDVEYFNGEVKKYLSKMFEEKIQHQICFLDKRIRQIRSMERRKGNKNKYIRTILSKIEEHNSQKGITIYNNKTTIGNNNEGIMKNIYAALSPKVNPHNNMKRLKVVENNLGASTQRKGNCYKSIPFFWKTEMIHNGEVKKSLSPRIGVYYYNNNNAVGLQKSPFSRPGTAKCKKIKKFMRNVNKDNEHHTHNLKVNTICNSNSSRNNHNNYVTNVKKCARSNSVCNSYEVNKKFFLKTNTSILTTNNKKLNFICPQS